MNELDLSDLSVEHIGSIRSRLRFGDIKDYLMQFRDHFFLENGDPEPEILSSAKMIVALAESSYMLRPTSLNAEDDFLGWGATISSGLSEPNPDWLALLMIALFIEQGHVRPARVPADHLIGGLVLAASMDRDAPSEVREIGELFRAFLKGWQAEKEESDFQKIRKISPIFLIVILILAAQIIYLIISNI